MEEQKKLNEIVANNITIYRKMAGLTQSALADMLHFSDKSVSKWERGEAYPDPEVLVKMCDIFDITLNDMVSTHKKRPIQKWIQKRKHILISAMSALLAWLIATIVFVVLRLVTPAVGQAWMCFIIAIPVSTLVLFIFSCIWGNPLVRAILISILIWTTLVSICIPFEQNIWILLCIAIPLQLMVILWYILVRLKNNKKEP